MGFKNHAAWEWISKASDLGTALGYIYYGVLGLILAIPFLVHWITGAAALGWIIPFTVVGVLVIVAVVGAAMRRGASAPSIGVPQPKDDRSIGTQSPSAATELFQDPKDTQIGALKTECRWWEYKYLSMFLVFRTQLVLDWFFFSTGPVSYNAFHAYWLSVLHTKEDRDRILNVLMGHFLVANQDGMLSISDKGKEFVKWRGPLPNPELPTAPAGVGTPSNPSS